jgi:hypothetical protein
MKETGHNVAEGSVTIANILMTYGFNICLILVVETSISPGKKIMQRLLSLHGE